jgi:putative PIN family toxin of toxin-antitoxin system
MRPRRRVVVDTGVLVSRLLVPHSTPARAVRRTIDECLLLVSPATLDELADVLARSEFDSYVSIAERQEFLRLLPRVVEVVEILRPIRACRDPKDDKFLELAVNGAAETIVTGDRDLLVLDPFRGVRIMTPADFLAVPS